MSTDAAIIDYAAGLLLRYFRGGAALQGDAPRLDRRRDLELLRSHWSLSEPVRSLVSYVAARPHEAQALLTYREQVDAAVARGRIDARKTWLYQKQSGLPFALVTNEAVRTFATGPNMLLAWVLREAGSYSARLLEWQASGSAYLPLIESTQTEMRKVQRIEALREPLRAVSLGQRPAAGSLRDAARSRRPLYRLAAEAYELLQGVERGDDVAMERVARTALVGPLEDWRRFELAVGLSAGEALSRATGAPLQLHLLGSNASSPVVTAGRHAIYWQQITAHHSPCEPEHSEIVTKAALKQYGVNVGTERPDFLVVDRTLGSVVAVIEVKYIAGDTAMARFREAVEQVVRYGRNYAETEKRDALLARSLVALSKEAPTRISNSAAAPFAADFGQIRQPHGLDAWAAAVLAA